MVAGEVVACRFAAWKGAGCRVVLGMMGLAGIGGGMVAGGCGAAMAQTTALTVDDFQVMASELAARLASSQWLRERGNESSVAVVTIARVENLTNDLMSQGEQWYVITRVRDSMPISRLRVERNLAFVMPAERASLLETGEGEAMRLRAPTHEMTATFRSARRMAALNSTEGYTCEFRITDLTTGEVVFVDSVGFKRVAYGRSYD